MKTRELIGPALDWAVAKANGIPLMLAPFTGAKNFVMVSQGGKPTTSEYTPSTAWAQGGPIIERESIQLTPDEFKGTWSAFMTNESVGYEAVGPTPLIAAMRCFVASKLGDEVEIPEGLK